MIRASTVRGWTLYLGDDPDRNVTTQFRRDCLGCHVPAAETDWLFIEGYPTLGPVALLNKPMASMQRRS